MGLNKGIIRFLEQSDKMERETGCKDQNGVEICKGDKLHICKEVLSERGEFEDYTDNYVGEVVWEEAAFWVRKTPYVKHLLGRFTWGDWRLKTFKVIKGDDPLRPPAL